MHCTCNNTNWDTAQKQQLCIVKVGEKGKIKHKIHNTAWQKSEKSCLSSDQVSLNNFGSTYPVGTESGRHNWVHLNERQILNVELFLQYLHFSPGSCIYFYHLALFIRNWVFPKGEYLVECVLTVFFCSSESPSLSHDWCQGNLLALLIAVLKYLSHNIIKSLGKEASGSFVWKRESLACCDLRGMSAKR